jgi:hypothetical protein
MIRAAPLVGLGLILASLRPRQDAELISEFRFIR